MNEFTQIVAAALHDNWRNARRIGKTQLFEPRIKNVKDQIWIQVHGKTTCDIANTPFFELPSEWQTENFASAAAAIDIIEQSLCHGCKSVDDIGIETASALIHVAWLERNSAWAEEIQKLPYDALPELEKEKDRVVFRIAAEIYKQLR